jgi:hypothetical protein
MGLILGIFLELLSEVPSGKGEFRQAVGAAIIGVVMIVCAFTAIAVILHYFG